MPSSILNVDCLETSLTLLPILDYSNTPPVPSTCNHNYISNIKLDEVGDFVALQVELDDVVRLDERVRVTDSTPIIGVQVWDTLLAELHRANFAQLELHQKTETIRRKKKPINRFKIGRTYKAASLCLARHASEACLITKYCNF